MFNISDRQRRESTLERKLRPLLTISSIEKLLVSNCQQFFVDLS